MDLRPEFTTPWPRRAKTWVTAVVALGAVGGCSVAPRRYRRASIRRADAPGRPGVRASKAVITLSTCRTPEDHAEGNYWSDEFDNPEHRIDKIGELVSIRPS